MENLRFIEPVKPGDTIQVRLTCKRKTGKRQRSAGQRRCIELCDIGSVRAAAISSGQTYPWLGGRGAGRAVLRGLRSFLGSAGLVEAGGRISLSIAGEQKSIRPWQWVSVTHL